MIRTQKQDSSTAHLSNSRETFLRLVEKVRTLDKVAEQQYIEARDYEGLDLFIINHLLGVA